MNIFVGNLAFSATEEGVRQLSEGYGTVDTVRHATDRDTGRPRGFGFVEMPDTTEARAAIAGLNGTSLDGPSMWTRHVHGTSVGGPGGDRDGKQRRPSLEAPRDHTSKERDAWIPSPSTY
jgi:RNA recognition motif